MQGVKTVAIMVARKLCFNLGDLFKIGNVTPIMVNIPILSNFTTVRTLELLMISKSLRGIKSRRAIPDFAN
jgi:hypothetical protein